MRTALTPADRSSVAAHETPWGFTYGYADEIPRRRAQSTARTPAAHTPGQANAL